MQRENGKNIIDKLKTGNKAIWLERGGSMETENKVEELNWFIAAFHNYILRVECLYIQDTRC